MTPDPLDPLMVADAAYTAAVQAAAKTGDWGHARQAREALDQVRAGVMGQ